MSQPYHESTLSHAAARGGLRGIAQRLVKHGLLTDDQAANAERTAASQDISILRHVIDSGLVKPNDAATAAGWEYGLPVIDLDSVRISSLPPVADYPVRLLRQLTVLPLVRYGHRLTVAVPYPATLTELDELQFATGFSVEGVLAPIDQLRGALEDYLAQNEASMMAELDGIDDAVSSLNFSQDEDASEVPLDEVGQDSDDAPIVKFVNKILLDAIRRGASDIHFEPYESQYRVRFRVDGILIEIARPPFTMRNRIAARLKIMARMDISERRLPQDGALKLLLSRSRSLDFRVNTLPTVYGEKIVMRLLDPAAAQMGIEHLGFTDTQRIHYEKALEQPQGMILVTGPTGSGKTVTLYTGINILNQTERNICTAEDPVEIKVPGINQVNVMPKIGLDFANALRAFLRQDPDIVMVGEVRDLETADIAIKASQTGHLVLSTVHTNSAAETLTRLANMGVTSFNIASAISLIIAQRLARKLCEQCKTPISIPEQALRHEGFTDDQIANATLFTANGCKQCTHGFKGRTGIYEVVPIGDELSELIMRDANAIEIDRLMRKEGHNNLRTSGLMKVMNGTTSLEEINRITRE
ncbi:type IV-A pilus assembly ATPase PilB [Halomonas sp. LS-001]